MPKLLDPEELAAAGPSDEKSVITYVAKLRQAILDKNAELIKQQKQQLREVLSPYPFQRPSPHLTPLRSLLGKPAARTSLHSASTPLDDPNPPNLPPPTAA